MNHSTFFVPVWLKHVFGQTSHGCSVTLSFFSTCYSSPDLNWLCTLVTYGCFCVCNTYRAQTTRAVFCFLR